MYKKWIVLPILAALLLAAACGCSSMTTDTESARGDKADMQNAGSDMNGRTDGGDGELNIQHLAALLGMRSTELDSVFSKSDADNKESSDGSRVYTHKMMGGDARISFESDGDDMIDKITVSVDKKNVERWKNELNEKFGTGKGTADNVWSQDNSSIRITEYGDNAVITITHNT